MVYSQDKKIYIEKRYLDYTTNILIMNKPNTINQKLLDIIQNDFDSCEWFIISSNELMKTLNDSIDLFKNKDTSFEEIRDYIGKIGMGIRNVEKCLDEVEECYNRIVEGLSDASKKK